MRYLVVSITVLILASCGDNASTVGSGKDTAVANITVDSSAVINDSTKLPKDSITTVTH